MSRTRLGVQPMCCTALAIALMLVMVSGIMIPGVATAATGGPNAQAGQQNPQGHDTHYVRLGDTLSGIALMYGTTMGALMRVNGLSNPNVIYIGQPLRIPTGSTGTGGASCANYHYVRYGETLSGIAYYYGVNPYGLAQANGLYDPDSIYQGQKLCIPDDHGMDPMPYPQQGYGAEPMPYPPEQAMPYPNESMGSGTGYGGPMYPPAEPMGPEQGYGQPMQPMYPPSEPMGPEQGYGQPMQPMYPPSEPMGPEQGYGQPMQPMYPPSEPMGPEQGYGQPMQPMYPPGEPMGPEQGYGQPMYPPMEPMGPGMENGKPMYPAHGGQEMEFWKGSYFKDKYFSEFVEERQDAEVRFNWYTESPGDNMPKDRFSVRWERIVYFPKGQYRFYAVADDGVRVYVDEQTVIDGWAIQPATEYKGDIYLGEGRHKVVVEYYEEAEDASIHVYWEPRHYQH